MSNILKIEEFKKYSKEELLLIIHEYILELNELSRRKTLDEESFEKPSWSEYQAFQLGYQKALSKLENFIPYPEIGK